MSRILEMSDAKSHLKALEEVEREGIPGLVEVLREEGMDAVRQVLWDATGWHRDYDPCVWRSRADEEQKRIRWEMAVRIEIICTVLHEAHKRQVEEVSWRPSARGRRTSTVAASTKSAPDGAYSNNEGS